MLLPHHAISALFEPDLFASFTLIRKSVFAALMKPRIDSKIDDQKADIRTRIDMEMPIKTFGCERMIRYACRKLRTGVFNIQM